MLKDILFVALGGASGALSRYGLVTLMHAGGYVRFPYGTMIVNVLGSFLIGIMYVLITERLALHPDWRSVLMVGFLGAFTTFSTFSLEAITLLENGQPGSAAAYVCASVGICLLAAWTAIVLTRLI